MKLSALLVGLVLVSLAAGFSPGLFECKAQPVARFRSGRVIQQPDPLAILPGRIWQLVGIVSMNDRVDVPDNRSLYTVEFKTDGSVKIGADCNCGTGSWTSTAPGQLQFGQIELNLERWRWHLQDLGETYVLVNIAGFDLKAVQAGRYVLEMPVIVGKLHHESPIFSNMIRYVEFNPFWNLTPHIARSETLPHLRQNPSYLAEKHIRLFSSWGQDAVELDPHQITWNKVTPRAMNHDKRLRKALAE